MEGENDQHSFYMCIKLSVNKKREKNEIIVFSMPPDAVVHMQIWVGNICSSH